MPFNDGNGIFDTSYHLEELSLTITHNASVVSQHLKANNLPQPSFNSDGPSVVIPRDSPQSVIKAQQDLIAAALEISQLAIGPSEFLPNLALGVSSWRLSDIRLYILMVYSSNMFLALHGSATTTYFISYP